MRCGDFGAHSRNRLGWLAVLLMVLMTACSDDDEAPTEPEVDEPVAETVTVSFSGSLGLGETSCHGFETTQTGNILMTLGEIQPLDTLTLGLRIGFFDETIEETQCSTIAEDSSVRGGEAFLAEAFAADRYCVCVLDVGNIFPDVVVEYDLEVTHP